MPVALILSLLGGAKRFGASALAFVSKLNPWQMALIAVSLFAAVQHFELVHAHHETAKWQKQFTAEHAGRLADRAAYQKAQADAAVKNQADVARDKAERERVTNDISQTYEAQLSSLRADLARRLQHSAAQGAPGDSGLPGVSAAPSGLDDAPRVSIPSGLYVHGAELELRLEKLQQWVREQAAINPNKP